VLAGGIGEGDEQSLRKAAANFVTQLCRSSGLSGRRKLKADGASHPGEICPQRVNSYNRYGTPHPLLHYWDMGKRSLLGP
jgi:hypothetical protein